MRIPSEGYRRMWGVWKERAVWRYLTGMSMNISGQEDRMWTRWDAIRNTKIQNRLDKSKRVHQLVSRQKEYPFRGNPKKQCSRQIFLGPLSGYCVCSIPRLLHPQDFHYRIQKMLEQITFHRQASHRATCSVKTEQVARLLLIFTLLFSSPPNGPVSFYHKIQQQWNWGWAVLRQAAVTSQEQAL